MVPTQESRLYAETITNRPRESSLGAPPKENGAINVGWPPLCGPTNMRPVPPGTTNYVMANDANCAEKHDTPLGLVQPDAFAGHVCINRERAILMAVLEIMGQFAKTAASMPAGWGWRPSLGCCNCT